MNTSAHHTPVEAKPAAAIMLLRDGEQGLEILIVRKARGQHFAAGALVFPGGRVCDEDHHLAERLTDGKASLLAHRLAAIREMHEECGILMARPRGANPLLDLAGVEAFERRHPTSSLDLLGDPDLAPATGHLLSFAHWITPPGSPRRFDTRFFIAAAPAGQYLPRVDGFEIVAAQWRRPADILAESEANADKLVLPTLMNLRKLNRWSTVAEALEATRAAEVVCVVPEREETPDGTFHRIPKAADYDLTMVPVEMFRRA